jgi:hypothetical protein
MYLPFHHKWINMLTVTSHHTKACFDAWMNCENLLSEIHSIRRFLSKQVLNVVDECAFICLGTFNAFKSGSSQIANMALLCVGICEECAEICDSQNSQIFRDCAKVSRECSDRLSDFTLSN